MGEPDECQFMDVEVYDHYWLKCVPPVSENLEFKYYLAWVRKDNLVPVKFEYYDQNNQLIRLLEVLKIDKIQGYPTATRINVKELKYGGESIVQLSNIRYDVGLKESLFTEQNLRKLPFDTGTASKTQ